MIRFSTVFAGLVLLCAIVWNGWSDGLTGASPAQALAIDPYNGDAALAVLASRIRQLESSDEASRQLIVTARKGASANPLESRFSSAAALAYLYEGDSETAIDLAMAARDLDRTDRIAADISARYFAEQGNYGAAVAALSDALLRNPGSAGLMVDVLAALASTEEGRQAINRVLDDNPVWAGRAIRAIAEQDDGYELVYRLLGSRDSEEGYDNTIDRIVADQFVAHRRYALGYRHFLQLLPSDREAGYVFNGDFAREPNGFPWDWRLQSTTQATVRRVAGATPYAEVAFREKPVQRIGMSQFIPVPPGRLKLMVEAQATGLHSGKPVSVQLDCVEPRKPMLASLDIPAGSYGWREVSLEFENEIGCRFGLLFLTGHSVKGSFKTTYAGSVGFRRVELIRAAS